MKKELLSGNEAAAWGARLSGVDAVPNFPVTPQTEIIETIAQWIADGEMDCEYIRTDSEHSVMSACIGTQSAGARTFTGTSSQGLLLMHEIVYVAAGLRLPIVMVNVSRGLSAPITLWSDFNDILDQRDSGWLIFFAQDNQEVLDTVIQAYKIAEDRHVLLPVIVNMEGFIHSYTREPVKIPSQKKVNEFLPGYKPKVILDPQKSLSFGPGVMEGYMYFKNQVHLAQNNAIRVIRNVQNEWEKKFKRKYDLVEKYMMDDAEVCLVTAGSMSTTAKHAVNKMRKKGINAGLVRIRVYRPWPLKDMQDALHHVKGIAVVDRDISPGFGGIFYNDIKSAMYGKDKTINSFIAGLGGKHISTDDFRDMINKTMEDAKKCRDRVEWVKVGEQFKG